MAGSDKRISKAQRKKIQVRHKKSGRGPDPATGLVLAAASMVPVAGVGARAAAVARTASVAAKGRKAANANKKTMKVEREYQAAKKAAKEKYGDDWFRHVDVTSKKGKPVKVVKRDAHQGVNSSGAKTKGERREAMLRERNSSAAKKAAKEAARKKRLRDAAKKSADKKQAKKDVEKAKYGPKPPTTQREANHRMEWDSLRARGLARQKRGR